MSAIYYLFGFRSEMMLRTVIVLLVASTVNSQLCNFYNNDTFSPFYWENYEQVCSEKTCTEYPWLPCNVPRGWVLQQAGQHGPESVLTEVEYLTQYFNSRFPQPDYTNINYRCKKVCPSEQVKLEQLFLDINSYSQKTGRMELQTQLCTVIGPELYYQDCRGKCQMPYNSGFDSYCVPDVRVTMDIWVYCPDAIPTQCHKVKYDVPISCACKKFKCLPGDKSIIPKKTKQIVIPPKPPGWYPGYNKDRFAMFGQDAVGIQPVDPVPVPVDQGIHGGHGGPLPVLPVDQGIHGGHGGPLPVLPVDQGIHGGHGGPLPVIPWGQSHGTPVGPVNPGVPLGSSNPFGATQLLDAISLPGQGGK